MRFVSLCTNAVAALIFGLVLTVFVPSVARADVPANGPGYTCAMEPDGVIKCTDGSLGGTGQTCVVDKDTGKQVCTNTGGGTGGGTGGTGGTGGGSSGGGTSTGTGFVSKITGWFSGAMSSFFSGIVALLKDMLVLFFGAVLALFAVIVEAIPVPDFIKTYSMGALLSAAGPDVGYFLNVLRIGQSLSIIGAAYAFRLLRKLLTLFQW
ncbi:hypothetical protein EC912_101759 [Luteibacter rhizovicinus]|uniref:DUF2523 domain-containing protein n=1 Tax=Luteibacter rhizovicinus TaxID=242606 RepID=A0A4R3YYV9_9GAMM|nr:DUF2523 family protein [Luteibacter rhizovicinus]TCV97742.1 hypothetical protein EC912_101759 [Luteibacter rhizovicinus]